MVENARIGHPSYKYDSQVKRELRNFSGTLNFAPMQKFKIVLWVLLQNSIFKSAFLPSRVRPILLKLFGASIGSGVVIRRGVRIHFPWNLEIGNDCWIGEEVWFINHAKIVIESDVCLSQRSVICSGGHDFRSSTLEYKHRQVLIKSGAWICFDAKILPGVIIGINSVISAGEVTRVSVPDYTLQINGDFLQIKPPDNV